MAYELKYELGFNSLQITGKVSIYEESGTPGSEILIMRNNSLRINYNWGSWEDPIIGLTASFSIVNNKDDFFELLPLLSAEEGKYFIKIEGITPEAYVMFEGYLNCEDNEQKYLHKQDIRLNASSYLSKLQYVDAPTIEDLENDTFINIIDNCLRQTGTTDNIRVNCSLYPVGTSLPAYTTLFNKCGIYKEVFWQNNIDRDSALEVIRKILTTFDCFLYWFAGYWYIERYADIWSDSQINYVEYTTGVEYWPTDSGALFGNTPNVYDFVDVVKMDTTQIITMIAGQRQVEINIEQQHLFSLVVNNFEAAQFTSENEPEPGHRQWLLYGGDSSGSPLDWDYANLGKPFRNIAKSAMAQNYSFLGALELYRGAYTTFRTTVIDELNMTITYKAGVYGNIFAPGEMDEYDVDFYWYLKVGTPGKTVNENIFIEYNDGTGLWEIVYEAGGGYYGLNKTNVPASEWDRTLRTCEVSVSIPFSDFITTHIPGGVDENFVFCIGAAVRNRTDFSSNTLNSLWIGDVSIACTTELDNNYIKGEINTSFLNKKTITQYFHDSSNLTIRNAIWYGDESSFEPDALDMRTQTWVDVHTPSGEALPLAEMKIKDAFRLYNKNSQKLTADIQNWFLYRPFTRFTDSNQADSSGGEGKHFVLVSNAYAPQEDRCSVTLSEYDVEEDINLI